MFFPGRNLFSPPDPYFLCLGNPQFWILLMIRYLLSEFVAMPGIVRIQKRNPVPSTLLHAKVSGSTHSGVWLRDQSDLFPKFFIQQFTGVINGQIINHDTFILQISLVKYRFNGLTYCIYPVEGRYNHGYEGITQISHCSISKLIFPAFKSAYRSEIFLNPLQILSYPLDPIYDGAQISDA